MIDPRLLVIGVICSVLVGCGPAAPTVSTSRSDTAPVDNRTLVVVGRAEIETLATKGLVSSALGSFAVRLFNASLATVDSHSVPAPLLAEALPVLQTDSWRVLPDGQMETMYRLKPRQTWQDGAPLTADDFVFGWQVYTAPELGVSRVPPQGLMQEVVAVDERTILIRWRGLYPEAGALTDDQFMPLPRHLLGETFRNLQPDAFSNSSFWTDEYVGLGPYRLDRWERGSSMHTIAFENYVLGRPRIARIELRFTTDPNAAMAALLAEAVQVTIDALSPRQALILKQQDWESQRGGTVLLTAGQLRAAQIQLKPEVVSPRALLDLRVRQALAHAMDKQALSDGLLEGRAITANTLVSPAVDYFPAVDRAVTKYPFDLARSQQLMTEAGLEKAPDGFYRDRDGSRLAPAIWVLAAGGNETEATLLIENLRLAGMDATFYQVPPSAPSSTRREFPAIFSRGFSDGTAPQLLWFTEEGLPTPENRFVGHNWGGWVNQDIEPLAAAYRVTLDRGTRAQQVVDMMRIISRELPAVPLYFNPQVVAHSSAVRGPLANVRYQSNIHEWEWR